ncbi:HYR domain-containing protein [Myxococcaceae bacterium GXIMD 01537]
MRLARGFVGALALGLASFVGCEGPAEESIEAPRATRSDALAESAPARLGDLVTQQSTLGVAGSRAHSFVRAGSRVFFALDDATHGAELWVTDGTEAGTRLVRDIAPGNRDSEPSELTEMGGVVYFQATDGTSRALWRSDGTVEGTRPVMGSTPVSNGLLTAMGQTLFFSGSNGASWSEAELWKTDGTEAGTVQVKDLHPSGGSHPDPVLAAGGWLYFTADDGESGRELWKTDGTEAGTVRVKDLTPGPGSSDFRNSPQQRAALGGMVFFVVDTPEQGQELWKSDGTEAGTGLVKDIAPGPDASQPWGLTVVGGTLYFTAEDAAGGRELWKSDGTEAGTVRVKDLAAGPLGSDVWELHARSGVLYFLANDGLSGRELWKSDGTEAGTLLVTDLKPGPESSFIGDVFVTDTQLILFARNAASGYTMWASDGSGSGLTELAALGTSSWMGTPPSSPLVAGSLLYFSAEDRSFYEEPWRTDGTPEGTHPVRDGRVVGEGSYAEPVVDLGGALLFKANNSGTELWKTDGTAAGTVQVLDGFALGSFARPLRMGSMAYFSAERGSSGQELWRSDGTAAGTTLVVDLNVGSGSSNPKLGVVLNNHLVFSASTAGQGEEIWLSNGTAVGTVQLRDIRPGAASSSPWPMVEVGGRVYFAADDGTRGSELWNTDGTFGGTTLVKDFIVGAEGSIPFGLRNVGGVLVFTAKDPTDAFKRRRLWRLASTGEFQKVTSPTPDLISSAADWAIVADGKLFFTVNAGDSSSELWTYDGVSTSATQVVSDRFGYLSPGAAVASGKVVYFRAWDAEHGAELWRTDGTAEGTRRVKDILPGPLNGVSLAAFTSLGSEQVMFVATDGVHGAEPWISDGTEAGTKLVGDLAPGPRTSTPNSFMAWKDGVFFQADDGPHGFEPWWFTLPTDTTPPALTCPAPVVAEAASSTGATASWPAAQATDDVTASPEVTYSHVSGSLFPLGTTTVTVTARDAAGNTSSCTFDVTVRDSTAPALSCPTNQEVEATGSTGATVSYADATATDAVTASLSVTYSHASGSTFPIGETSVTATATDAAGNQGTCTFFVSVRDSTRPALSCPDDFVQEATSASGAPVSFSVTATDAVTPSPSVTYSHAPGSTFPFGVTTVTATATDGAGNEESCWFLVTVRDTTAPALSCPAPVTVEATSASGALVPYAAATASDSVSSATVTHSHASDSPFPLGITPVTATARDAAGNTSSCTFDVTVRDSTAPALTCPADLVLEATGTSGAAASFSATAADAVTSSLTVGYSHAPGGTFPLGETTVTAMATDAAGNEGSCAFRITVRDTTAPSLSCPAPVTAEATRASGANVSYSAPTASDSSSAVTVTPSHASGSPFPLGTTAVTVTARDAAGNESSCAFDVTVRDTTAPALTCPADLVREATDAEGASVGFSATVADAVTASPAMTYSHAPGTHFAPGETAVTLTARDDAGNSSACTFRVTVRDTTAPALACPAPVTVEATRASGTQVSYAAATASDSVSLVETTYSHASESAFALGTTPVTVTARDAAGNTSSCTFDVTVRDTTAPTLTCPADLSVPMSDNEDRAVQYPAATVADAVSPDARVAYNPASGTTFPRGTTSVSVTATDAAGNTSSCAFRVTVRPAIRVPVTADSTGCGAAGGAPSGLLGALAALTGAALRRSRKPRG